jgi:hypothetical protein
LRRLWGRRNRCRTAGDPGAGPAVATGGGQPTRVPLEHRTRQLGLNGRPASRPACTNQFTNNMQKALSLFEKGPLALVAGEGFEPSTSGRRAGALCACGVITQGPQFPRTGVRGGSPGEKGQVESLTDRLLSGVADAQLRLDEREYLAVRGCPPASAAAAAIVPAARARWCRTRVL